MLVALVLCGVGTAWGDVSTLTFTAACNGSGTANDGAIWTVASDADESTFDTSRGIHYGTNKKAVQSITLTTSSISGTITKVVVNASGNNSPTLSVKVGDADFGTPKSNITTSNAAYTFEGSASGQIVVDLRKSSSATGALYVKSIEVTTDVISNYTVTFDAGAGTYVGNNDFPEMNNTKSAGKYTLPSATRNGYTFNGWVAGNSEPITGDYTVFADVNFTANYIEGDFKKLSFDVSTNPGNWPIDNSTTLTNYIYTLNNVDYTFALKNVKSYNGYLMLTSTAVLGLPAIEGYKLTKVIAKNSNGCSTKTIVGVSSSPTSASYIGDPQTWSTTGSTYTYNLTSTEANTMYYLYVTNANAQVLNLTLTYEAAKEKGEAGLVFSNATVTAERGQTFIAPTLTNSNNLPVTYSSSNETVATVNSETGEVTLLKAGETTITATFAGDKDYKPGSASYTLTVTAPSHTATFFVNGQQKGEGLSVAEDAAITFPEIDQEIPGKTFVGWTTTAIDGEQDTAPKTLVKTDVMGTANVTYYAVFATADASGEPVETKAQTLQYDTWTYRGTTTDKSTYRLFGNGSYIESDAFDLSKLSKVNVYGGTFGGSSYNSLTIGDGTNTWKSVTVSGSSQTGSNTYTNGTALTGTNKLLITATAGNGTSTGIRISKVEIFIIEPTIVYSAYCTTVGSPEPVVEPGTPVEIAEGYYSIKNGNGQYVNVAGRKTVTFVDEADIATAPGTVIRVKADDKGQVQILRSQGVDIPGYAEKAMNYVPKIVKLVVDKLHAEGSGSILGEHGLDAIMAKFDESFDYHLYTEQAEGGVRIYGKTPSMQPVVDFYAENKTNVDAKLPMLETFINDAIQKILNKTNGSGASILVPFSLETVWQKMGGTLTEPVDDATKLAFLQQVLADKENVWNFAYQTAMIYWGNLKNHPRFIEMKGQLGEYAQYIDKIEYIRPDVKYYLVQNDGKIDFFSQGNVAIINNDPSTLWTLEDRTEFKVAIPEDNMLNDKYYTTLYTDFAYTLPEGMNAYKVTSINPKTGVAARVIITGTIPAQTPVLLESESAETLTLTLDGKDTSAAPTDNVLVGPDYLINTYNITTAQIADLFGMAKDIIGEQIYNNYLAEYEHLMMRNSGTVNNKYFFGLDEADVELCTFNNGKDCVVRNLSMSNGTLGFYDNWEVNANKAFLVSEKFNPVKIWLKGDVNRDGEVNVTDAAATVDISLNRATPETHSDVYDFDAADADENGTVNVNDAVIIVNISLGRQ